MVSTLGLRGVKCWKSKCALHRKRPARLARLSQRATVTHGLEETQPQIPRSVRRTLSPREERLSAGGGRPGDGRPGEEPYQLDKDALARLRRYYSRRSMADLRLAEMGGPLRKSFESIADSIRSDEVSLILRHELPATRRPSGMSRPAPLDDAQLMFFLFRKCATRRSRTTLT